MHYKKILQKTRTINVDDPTWQKMHELAKTQGCSVSELIRTMALKNYEKLLRQQKSKQELKQEMVVNQ